MFPAGFHVDNVVSISSSEANNDKVTMNYGHNSVDLFVPSDNFPCSTAVEDFETGGLYGPTSGQTSMAAPHVSGAIALMKVKYPSDSYLQIINRLLTTVDSNQNYLQQCVSQGRLNLYEAVSQTTDFPAPINDDFQDALILIRDVNELNYFRIISAAANNVHATKEIGEPNHAVQSGGSSVWWKWQAPSDFPSNVPLRVHTGGSNLDTLLAVYDGTGATAFNQLILKGQDNNSYACIASAVVFTPTANHTYFFAIDGVNGVMGSIRLNLEDATDPVAESITFNIASLNHNGTVFGLAGWGPSNTTLELQSTKDYVNWDKVAEVVVSGSGQFSHNHTTAESYLFYRLNTIDAEPLSVSCNTIGFVRKALIAGYNLVQNPLIANNNTVAALFTNPPDALTLYFWDYASQGYGPICSYDFGEWTNGETIALPGEGFWLQNPTSAYTEVIFVGEVADGYHEISVTDAWDLVGTPIPIEGKVGADLVFPAVNNDEIRKSSADGTGNYITYKYINGMWNKYINDEWVPEEPYFELAEAFFSIKAEGLWWRRNFTPWTGDFEYLE